MDTVMLPPELKPATQGAPYASEAARWQAVTARDPKADGHFVYAVKTTGVYCHPSSTARRPKRENVEFFDTPEAAEAAGYRASRRAVADHGALQAHRGALLREICAFIQQADTPPRLDELAEKAGLSPFHLHRLFKAEMGLTPKAYADAARAQRLRRELGRHDADSVTHTLYEAGFNSSSRFYEASDGLLGMPPRDYRQGGINARIRFAVGQCSLGAILVAQSQRGICAILLGDDPDKLVRDLQDMFPKAEFIGGDSRFERLVAQVVGFVEEPGLGLGLPLDIQGTAFQERVWQALREIPPGSTATYSDIAQRLGSPRAVRAVGSACGANRLAVAIPCHRVLRRDGDLSGYRWGVERKRELLEREAGPGTLGSDTEWGLTP